MRHAIPDGSSFPVLLGNGTMFVSTLTVGGHPFADVLAGAGLTIGAILLVRRRTGVSHSLAMRLEAVSNSSTGIARLTPARAG